jgi:hypothetical protein
MLFTIIDFFSYQSIFVFSEKFRILRGMEIRVKLFSRTSGSAAGGVSKPWNDMKTRKISGECDFSCPRHPASWPRALHDDMIPAAPPILSGKLLGDLPPLVEYGYA